MTDTDAPAHVPTEDDTLTTGPDEGFSIDAFQARVDADKYEGFEEEMVRLLSRRSVLRNTRRWAITWHDHTVTEDEYNLDACGYAQQYTGAVWGFINTYVRHNGHINTQLMQGVLYGMAREVLGMDDATAREAVGKLTPAEAAEILTYRDGEPRPKSDTGQ